MPDYKSTINCEVVKRDYEFERCVNDLSAEACLQRVGDNAAIPSCNKWGISSDRYVCINNYINSKSHELEVKQCESDPEKFYFKVGRESFAMCDSEAPVYLADVSSSETFKCSISPTEDFSDDVPKYTNFVLEDGKNSLKGWCSSYLFLNWGLQCVAQNDRNETVVVGLPVVLHKFWEEAEGDLEASRHVSGVKAKLVYGMHMFLIEEFPRIVDAVITKGLDTIGIDKVTEEELKKLAVCNEGELCGTRVKQASALLDAQKVRNYINSKIPRTGGIGRFL